jgi:hypothetical protein
MTASIEKNLLMPTLPVPSLGIDWLEDRRIVVFKPEAIYSAVLSTWAEEVLRTLSAWPDERPCLVMYDLSARGVGLMYSFAHNHDLFHLGVTLEGKVNVAELLQQRPALQGRLAIVLSARLSGKFVNRNAIQAIRAQAIPTHPTSGIESRTYLDRESALLWLRAGLTTPDGNTLPTATTSSDTAL